LKKLKGSLSRPSNRRPLKTRYTHSKIIILNFMDFKGSGTVHLGRAVRGATERARASRQNGRHLAAAVSAHGWRATINPPYVKASRTTRRAAEPGRQAGRKFT
ncbi:MAG TPA: hypothetical protein DDW90_05685, partial [Cyanobacteria bacterium UBA9971]|nr:hypothetical protein [Cyanobacteria bacterium UBA9971]